MQNIIDKHNTMSSLTDSIFGNVSSKKKKSSSLLSNLFQKKTPQQESEKPIVAPADDSESDSDDDSSSSASSSNDVKETVDVNEQEVTTATTNATATQVKRKERKPKAEVVEEEEEEEEEPPIHPTKEQNNRTVFVGNLPSFTTRKMLRSLFVDCGKVQSTRLRSLAVTSVKLPPNQAGNQKLMRKVCANTSQLDPESSKTTIQGYVVFLSKDSMTAALAKNNALTTLGGNKNDETTTRRGTTRAAPIQQVRLRVDTAEPTVDPKRSVFCGNLPYGADEESLQMHFVKGCSAGSSDDDIVESVRIIRNPDTMQCRGFGYVRLRDFSMVALALQMHDTVYMKRNLRVFVCGKRFKGKRGNYEDTTNAKPLLGAARRRSFEGRRATEPPSSNKRQKTSSSPNTNNTNALPSLPQQEHKRRTHSERNAARAKQTGTKAKPGVSKREASKVKLEKRVKKIQGRISKGMGKAKKF